MVELLGDPTCLATVSILAQEGLYFSGVNEIKVLYSLFLNS